MDVLGRLSLYEFVGVLIPGAVAVGGSYWALVGVPNNIAATEILALIVIFYVAGQLMQALLRVPFADKVVGTRREARTSRLMDTGDKPYSPDFRALLAQKAKVRGWPELATEPSRVLALARAELRAKKLDSRAETLLAMHFLSLGLTVASCLVAVSAAIATVDEFRWSRVGAIAGSVAAAALFRRRADDYDRYYADHVWADFAVLPESVDPATATGPA